MSEDNVKVIKEKYNNKKERKDIKSSWSSFGDKDFV